MFIICVLSFAGLLAFPWLYKISFQYILATFTALAVGTLFGDAMFHLIPFVRIDKVFQLQCSENLCFLPRHWDFIVMNRAKMEMHMNIDVGEPMSTPKMTIHP